MLSSGLERTELTLLALAAMMVALGFLAKRIRTPYPIVLVIGGLCLSLLPGMPAFRLNPDIVFYGFLPPLLFSAALNTSWRDFRRNLVSIVLLAFGLVAFTTVGIALFAHFVIPNLDWRLGLVLGAVISPTDAIAATSIARQVGLPRRITDILEGESLINDATGLLALEFAIGLVVAGRIPTVAEATGRLFVMTCVGIAVGVALGKFTQLIGRHLDDAPLEITISIVTPFAAYLLAEAMHTSGVLATVAAGLFVSRNSARYLSSKVRIDAHGVWNTLDFLLNGLVFVLIGLQLPEILAGIRFEDRKQLFWDAALLCAMLIALRLVWEFPGAYLSYWIRTKLLRQQDHPPEHRHIFVTGWTGMRGVIALAAALTLPRVTASGDAFPQRSLLIFLTFCVIFVTLVVQGLTLPPLIRKLGLAGTYRNKEELQARRAAIHAALDYLKAASSEHPEHGDVYEEFRNRYRRRLRRLAKGEDESEDLDVQFAYRDVGKELRKIERSKLIQMRDNGEINDHVLRTLQREIDLLDARYTDAVD
jgi:CPA1 family monovalent cation:H+ antiporter